MENVATNQTNPPLVNATCKLGEKGCYKNGRCHWLGNCENKITTNADRVRAMSDEEMMQFLFYEIPCENICPFCVPTMRTKSCDGHCKNGILAWLKQPADGGADNG